MIFMFLFSCIAHKTSLTGIIDYVGGNSCTVVLETGDMVVINSELCKHSAEGDVIKFYARRQ